MSANINPRYTLTGDPSSNNSTTMAPTFTTAAADYDGTTATHNKILFTAGSNGARIAGIRFKAIGSNVTSVARIFVNNGSAATSAANNSFVGEQPLPATTASNTLVTQPMDFIFPGGFIDLPSGFRILAGLATTVSAGWVATPIMGGQF